MKKSLNQTHPGVIHSHALVVAAIFLLVGSLGGIAHAGTYNWTNNASSTWSAVTNWDSNPNPPANAAGDVINLTNDITVNVTVTLDTSATNGFLNIGDIGGDHSFTLATNGSTTMTFNNGASAAQIYQPAFSSNNTISASMSLSSDLLVTNDSSYRLDLKGPILGSKNVTVYNRGSGDIAISSASGVSTFSGGLRLALGKLVLLGGNPTQSGGAINGGSVGTGTFTVEDGTVISWSTGGVGLGVNAMAVNGNITLTNTAQRLTMQTPLRFGGQTRIFNVGSSSNASYALQLPSVSGPLGIRFGQAVGSGPLPSLDSGTLRLVGNAPWSGVAWSSVMSFTNNAGLTIGNNVLTSFSGNNQLGGTPSTFASVTVESGGYLNLGAYTNSRSQSINSLAGAGTVCNLATNAFGVVSPGTATLVISNASATVAANFSGSIVDGAALSVTAGIPDATGLVAVAKGGSGVQTLSGNNTYSGSTTVSGGTLFVNGTHTNGAAATGAYTIGSGATLGGNGTINLSAANLNVTVNSGGKVSPGSASNTVGTLTFTLGSGTLDLSGAVTPVASGALQFNLAGTNTSDKILVSSGSANIGTLEFDDFVFTTNAGLQTGTYTLIQTPSSLSGSLGSSITGVVGPYNASIAISPDGSSVRLILSTPSKPIPSFSNLTPSQTILAGTATVILTGRVSASGPVYPLNGESGTVHATINGNTANGTFTNSTGNFVITFPASSIPASGTPYTITYDYDGDASLDPAANDTSTTLTVTSISTWTGSSSVNFETAGNWNPALTPTSDLISVTALFSGAPTLNQPSLTTSRSIAGLNFNTTTGGWTLSSSSAANVLAVGTNGISTAGQTSGSNVISAKLDVAATQTWKVGTGGTLLITGSVINSDPTTNYSITVNASGNLGNVILSPSAGNSVVLDGSNNAACIFQVKSGGVLELGGDGVTAPVTTSSNYIYNSERNTGFGTWGITGSGKVQVNSGDWITSDLGRNGSVDRFTGTLEIKGGLISFTGARYLGEGTINVSGSGVMKVVGDASGLFNGGKFALGSQANGATNKANMNVTGGFVDLASAASFDTFTGNSIGALISTLLNQNGGIIQNGVTYGGLDLYGNTNANTSFTIGGNSIANNYSALTLVAGTFISAGVIHAAGPAGSPGVNNFNFMGGTLAAAAVDATDLGSSPTATATANQTNVSDNIGTLVNYGGTLAPGNLGAAGFTGITGSYSNATGAASLAIDIGGTTAADAFTNAAGYFDNVSISGDAYLDGSLKVSLINAFTPLVTDTFTIINATNSVVGNFTNLNSGRVTLASNPSASFRVTVGANAVVLDDYQVAAPSTPPTISKVILTSSTNLLMTGTNNAASGGGQYYVITSTNIAFSVTNAAYWSRIATNAFAADGRFTNNLPVTPGEPKRFYSLQLP